MFFYIFLRLERRVLVSAVVILRHFVSILEHTAMRNDTKSYWDNLFMTSSLCVTHFDWFLPFFPIKYLLYSLSNWTATPLPFTSCSPWHNRRASWRIFSLTQTTVTTLWWPRAKLMKKLMFYRTRTKTVSRCTVKAWSFNEQQTVTVTLGAGNKKGEMLDWILGT